MGNINIKEKDDKLMITIDEKVSNRDFLKQIKDKLERIFVINNSKRKEIILDISRRDLSNKEILEMFDIIEESDRYIISKINCKKVRKEEIMILKGNIRNGEVKVSDKSVLLIGNINRGAKLIVDGNLYVLGKINGDIELKDLSNRIYCNVIYNSLIKIGNCYSMYSEELTDQVIYVFDNNVVNNDYRIGEINNVKSNSCYIW